MILLKKAIPEKGMAFYICKMNDYSFTNFEVMIELPLLIFTI
jgi:hypothetical protein